MNEEQRCCTSLGDEEEVGCETPLGGSLLGDIGRTAYGAAWSYKNPATIPNMLYNATRALYKRNTIHRVAEVPSEVKGLAYYAQQAYEPHRERQLRVGNYVYMAAESSPTVALYLGARPPTTPGGGGAPPSRRALIAIRGTTNARDFIDDIAVATSKLSPNSDRVREVLSIVSRLPPTYNTLLLTGHSLGGTVASVAGNILEAQGGRQIGIVSFNIGSSPVASPDCKRCIHHIIAGDLVSTAALANTDGAKVVLYDVQKPNLNPHALAQFL